MRLGVVAGLAYLLLSLLLTFPVLARPDADASSGGVAVAEDGGSRSASKIAASYPVSAAVPPGVVGLMMGAGLIGLYFCATRPEARR